MGKLSMVYLCCCFRREVDLLVDFSCCTMCQICSDPFYILTTLVTTSWTHTTISSDTCYIALRELVVLGYGKTIYGVFMLLFS